MAMKIDNIAIMPYSFGDNRRAMIRPMMKFIPAVEKRSKELQTTPLIVFFFSDSDMMVEFL